jgi:hypothetical protein
MLAQSSHGRWILRNRKPDMVASLEERAAYVSGGTALALGLLGDRSGRVEAYVLD